MNSEMPLLEIRDLTTRVTGRRGEFLAVDGVSLALGRGRALGIVGESGSGKSLLALSILRLVPEPAVQVVSGEVLLEGRDLLQLSPRELRAVRGRRIAMAFQDPAGSLNPVFTIGDQIAEAVRLHRRATRADARVCAIEALRAVGIADPATHVDSYPHQLSGGMRQRALIAMALACEPDVLIADEPTTALDATVQVQVLDLLRRIRAERQLSLLVISHDLTAIANSCDEVAVMYAGAIVERAPSREIFASPAHPYTRALLDAAPRLPSAAGAGRTRARLATIPGAPPDPFHRPAGCAFAPRCPRAAPACAVRPALEESGPGRAVACHSPLSAAKGRTGT